MSLERLDPATTLGSVHLDVTDLERAVGFYTRHLGFALLGRTPGVARLGAGDRELLVLHGGAGGPRSPRTTGLFHFAVVVPSRALLANVLVGLIASGTPLQGAADHGVSEALYLADPDGNGIEIYRDRPRTEWPMDQREVRMISEPLDLEGLLEERTTQTPSPLDPGSHLGHMHVQVSELQPAHDFYVNTLGFDLMQRFGHSALFVSAGGYHHHVGVNTWAGVGAPRPDPFMAGLRHFEVRVPDSAELGRVRARFESAGVAVVAVLAGKEEPDAFEVEDPSGNRLRFIAG